MTYAELTQIEKKTNLLMIGFGSCGITGIIELVKETPIEKNGHLRFVAVESNLSSLQKAFGKNNSPKIQEWLAKEGAVEFIVLGDDYLGMGGDADRAASLAARHKDCLEAIIEQFDIILLYGGAGGGTAGAMPVFAKIIADKGKTVCATITTPSSDEGPDPGVMAASLCQKLLDICPTEIIYNENVVDKQLSTVEAWDEINRECLFPHIRFMRDIILTVGERDIDANDLKKVLDAGRHMLCGFVDVDDNATPDADFKKRLFQNQYLQQEVLDHAVQVLFWFIAKWSLADKDAIMNYVHGRVKGHGGSVNIKPGIHEITQAKKAVGFLAIAKTLPTHSIGSITSSAMLPAPSSIPGIIIDSMIATETSEPLVTIRGDDEQSGEQIIATAPASLVRAYEHIFTTDYFPRQEAISIQQKLYKYTRRLFRLPARAA